MFFPLSLPWFRAPRPRSARRRTGNRPCFSRRLRVEELEPRLAPSLVVEGLTPGQKVSAGSSPCIKVSALEHSDDPNDGFSLVIGLSYASTFVQMWLGAFMQISAWPGMQTLQEEHQEFGLPWPSPPPPSVAVETGWSAGDNLVFAFEFYSVIDLEPDTTPCLIVDVQKQHKNEQGFSHLVGIPDSVTIPFQVLPHPDWLSFQTQPASGYAGPLGPVQVKVEDDQWQPKPGVAVSLSLGQVGSSTGALLSGTTTASTDANGIATFNNLVIDTPGQKYYFIARSDNSLDSYSTSFNLAAERTLSFTQQPTSCVPGPLQPVEVQVLNHLGEAVADLPVVLTLQSANGAVLTGTTTVQTDDQGIATFENLVINKPGLDYTLTASAPRADNVISDSFFVGEILSFTKQPTSGPTGPLKPVRVQALDPEGQPVADVAVTLFLDNANGATLAGTTTVQTDADGIASFEDLVIDKHGKGYTLIARAESAQDVTSTPFDLARTLTWTGGGDGLNWSDPDNWDIQAAPENSDDLIFPPGGEPRESFNNLDGLTLDTIILKGSDYQLRGNPLTLTGGLTSEADSNVYALDTALVGTTTFEVWVGNLEIASRLGGDGGFSLGGAGKLLLDQLNIYTGLTILTTNSTVIVTADNDLGTGGLIVAGQATIDTTGYGWPTLDNPVTFLNGAGLETRGNLTLTGGLSLQGRNGLGPAFAEETLRLDGAVTGSGTLTVNCPGTVLLNGTLDAASRMSVQSGKLVFAGELTAPDDPSNPQAIVGGGTLDLLGFSGTGSIDVQSGTLLSELDSTCTGTVTLRNDSQAKMLVMDAFGLGPLVVAGSATLDATEACWAALDNPVTFRNGASLTTLGNLGLNGGLTLEGPGTLVPAGVDDELVLNCDLVGTGPLIAKGKGKVTLNASEIKPLLRAEAGTMRIGGKLMAPNDPNKPQATVAGGILEIMGISGTGAITVHSGTLRSYEIGCRDYLGQVTLETEGTIQVRDSIDAFGLGRGTLDLVGGKLQNSASGSAALRLINDVILEGNVAIDTGDGGLSFQGDSSNPLAGIIVLSAPSQVTITGDGGLVFDATTYLAGSAPVTFTGTGAVGLGGVIKGQVIVTTTIQSESKVQSTLFGTLEGEGVVKVADPKSVLVLGKTLSGRGGIDIQSGILKSDNATSYQGNITLRYGGKVEVGADDALGTGTLIVAAGDGARSILDASGAGKQISLSNIISYNESTSLKIQGNLDLFNEVLVRGENILLVDQNTIVVLHGATQTSGIAVQGQGCLEVMFPYPDTPLPEPHGGSVWVMGDVAPTARVVALGSCKNFDPTLVLDCKLLGQDPDRIQVSLQGGTIRLLSDFSGNGGLHGYKGTLTSDSCLANFSGTITLAPDNSMSFRYGVHVNVGADNALGTGRLVFWWTDATADGQFPTISNTLPEETTEVILANPVTFEGQMPDDWVHGYPASGGASLNVEGNVALLGAVTLKGIHKIQTYSNVTLDVRGNLEGPGVLYHSGPGRLKVSGVVDPTVFLGCEPYYDPYQNRSDRLQLACKLESQDQEPQVHNLGGTLELLAGLTGTGSIVVSRAQREEYKNHFFGQLLASETNNYRGSIYVWDKGEVYVRSSGALGTGPLSLLGATLVGSNFQPGERYCLTNPVKVSQGVLSTVTFKGGLEFLQSVSVAADTTLDIEGADTEVKITGQLSGQGSLRLDGSTLIVTRTNPYFSGKVILDSGMIFVGSDYALGLGTGWMISVGRAWLDSRLANGDPIVANPLTVASGTLSLHGQLTFPQSVTVEAGATLNIEGDGTQVVISGPVQGCGTIIVGPGTTLQVSNLGGFSGTILETFCDDFQRPDGQNLGPDWATISGGLEIKSNQLKMGEQALELAVLQRPPMVDQSVQANIVLGTSGLQYGGLVSRFTDLGNMYYGEMVACNGAYAGYLYRAVGGDYQMLSYGTVAPEVVLGNGNDLLRFETVGHSLNLYLNNDLVTSANDSALSRGLAGLWGGYYTGWGNAKNFVLDNFRVQAVNPVPLPFADDFQQSNGSLLGQGWIGRGGGFVVHQGQLRADRSAFSMATARHAPVKDMSVQANMAVHTGSGLQYGGLVTRFTDLGNMYYGEMVACDGAYAGYLYRAVKGDYQMLTFGAIDPTLVKGDGTDLLRFDTVGRSLELYFNDVLVTHVLDTALTGGVVGVWGGYYTGLGPANSFVLDNFSARDVTLNNVSLPFTDPFTQAEGSLPSPSWQVWSGNFLVKNNCLKSDPSPLSLATLRQDPEANLSVEASIVLGTSGLQYGGLVARFNDPGNMYVAEIVAYNGAYAGYIFRVRNGAWTMLSYGTIDASAVKGDGTDVVRFETDWTSLQLFFNDSKVTEATDADPALGSGVSGLWGGPNFTLDNFGVKPLT